MGKLTGRTALVTGAASGIGLAIARALAAHGARICMADKQVDKLNEAAASIGLGATSVIVDLADVGALPEFVTNVTSQLGDIDILVNAAGMCHWESWGDVTPGNFDLIVAVNCRGLLFLTQAVAQQMIGGGKRGSIINVASIAARRGDPTNVVYSMSKAAVVSLTQSAASAYGAHGIRVNAIAPGFTQTPLLDKLFAHQGARLKQDRAQQENSAMSRMPLGRIGTPEDQACAAVFLALDDSSLLTGQVLNVDGGLYMN